MQHASTRKRPRSRSPPPWHRQPKSPRKDAGYGNRSQDNFAREQSRRNRAQENETMKQWLSEEDDFVLKQSKTKAKIRIREGRAKPIDWLAIVLGIADPTSDVLEEESALPNFEIPEPIAVVEGLTQTEHSILEKDITHYLAIEKAAEHRIYWNAAKTLCQDRMADDGAAGSSGRGLKSVSSDIDKILAPKSLQQLQQLEKQVNQKLDSNEPIDEDYWERLLARIEVFKAREQLIRIFASVMAKVATIARSEHILEADTMRNKFVALDADFDQGALDRIAHNQQEPETLLGIPDDDRGLKVVEEDQFLARIATDRQKVIESPQLQFRNRDAIASGASQPADKSVGGSARSLMGQQGAEDSSHATKVLYDREAARGVEEDEEVFAGEELIASSSTPQWSGKHRPRKPRYFNRVQMGYEWNKYNQTHYDHDHPPPKVVQGYKFNIFYPELIDKTKAPTYKIERENGRKRGQTFAPAGEEDNCVIRFIAGAPYEDIAFRIVDKEWDYSAKRERGFRSSFDKGILQLHFHFKKVYYRK